MVGNNKICQNFISVLNNEDIQEYGGEGIWNLIQAIFTGNIFSAISAGKNIKELIFHIPTAIFWSKIKTVGLIEQSNDNDYIFTDLAKSLKMYSLSSDETSKTPVKYLELAAPEELSFIKEDIENMFNGATIQGTL